MHPFSGCFFTLGQSRNLLINYLYRIFDRFVSALHRRFVSCFKIERSVVTKNGVRVLTKRVGGSDQNNEFEVERNKIYFLVNYFSEPLFAS